MPCTDCKLGFQCPRPLTGSGNNFQPKLFIIGLNPGKEDYERQQPFTSGAGRILNALLSDAGIPRSSCYFSYAVRCYPPNNRPPEKDELAGCRGNLRDELLKVKPSLIVALGEDVARELTGKSVHTWRGTITDGINSASGFKVLITYDPLFLMRMRSMYTVVTWDLHKALYPSPLIEEQYLINPNRSIIDSYFKSMMDKETAVDIETNGLEEDEHKAGLNPWAKSFDIIGISFTPAAGQALQLSNAALIQNWDLVDTFLSTHSKLAYQNNTFDRCALMVKRGYLTSCVWDTLNGMHLINSALPKKLDFIRSIYTNLPPYKEVYKTDGKYIPGMLNEQALGRLNCLDTDVTWIAAQEQKKFVSQHTMTNFLANDDIAIEMRVRGILVDQTKLVRHYAKILPTIKELKEKFQTNYQCSLASPKQLNALLYNEIKFPCMDLEGKSCSATKSSTNEKAIQAIAQKIGLIYLDDRDEGGSERFEGDHKDKTILSDILTFRGLSKIASTYCEGVYKAMGEDKILHPQWCTATADSERWSCRGTPMQGFPKEMRDMIVARPGKVYFGGDYKGAQILAAAILSEDWELAEKMLNPEYSLHNEVMEAIRPYYASVQKVQAKGVVFGTFFGRQPAAIARAFQVPTKTAQLWQDIFFAVRPKLKQYLEIDLIEFWKKHGYVEGVQGFKKYTEAITEAKCHPVQNFEAVITKTALIELKRQGFTPVLFIHDQIVCEENDLGESLNKERFEQFINIMEHVCPEYFHRYPVEGAIGYSWTDAT